MLHFIKNFRKYPLDKRFVLQKPHVVQQITDIQKCARNYSTENRMKVTLIGALGRSGQPLALMLKQNPLIDELHIHDVKPTCALAMELNHIDTKCRVTSHTGNDNLQPALENAKVVVVIASAKNSSHLRYDEMLEMNAPIIISISEAFAKYSPKALLAIATNPVNSIVPLAYKILAKNSCFNSHGLFGVTTLDVVRANTFTAETQGLEPECVSVPVIGGHSGKTVVPVLSQARPCADFTNEEIGRITQALQHADKEIIKIRKKEAATLSQSFAVARFVISLVKAAQGVQNIVECAYVRSTTSDHINYLATPVQLGPNGIQNNLGLPTLSDYEECLLDNAVIHLAKHIKAGEELSGVKDPYPCDVCDPDPNAPPCPPDWCEKEKQRAKEMECQKQ